MATRKHLPIAAIAATAVLLALPMSGITGSASAPLNILVRISPSASLRLQNAADLAPSGYTAMTDTAPVLVLNTPPVRPEVVVEVSADVAGPVTSQLSGEEGAELSGQDSAAKLVSARDLGVAAPPPARRGEGTDLRETFERAAGEIIYRLDLLKDVKRGLRTPVIISVNL